MNRGNRWHWEEGHWLEPEQSVPDWANGKIQATGQGAVDPERFPNPAQRKLMARRGAILDARRNLLERVRGLRWNSETFVGDLANDSDLMDSNASGLVRNAYVINENFDGSTYTVNMELRLYDVYTYIKKDSQ